MPKDNITREVVSVKYNHYRHKLTLLTKNDILYLSISDLDSGVFTNLHGITMRQFRKISRAFKLIDKHMEKQNQSAAAKLCKRITTTPSRTKSDDNDPVRAIKKKVMENHNLGGK
jgi:hypothetical protein